MWLFWRLQEWHDIYLLVESLVTFDLLSHKVLEVCTPQRQLGLLSSRLTSALFLLKYTNPRLVPVGTAI